MNFIELLCEEDNKTLTENGLMAYRSTNSSLVDMFSIISSLRHKNEKDVIKLYNMCLNEDKELAIKLAFYIRSIRTLGQGERNVGRILFKHLAMTEEDILRKNIELIPYYGRYDDLYSLVNTPLEKEMFNFMYNQIKSDLEAEYPSLLAKWLISANSKGKKANLGILTAKYFAYFKTNNPKYLERVNKDEFKELCREYRLILSQLRKRIDIIERKLCTLDYDNIDLETIPSQAFLKYRHIFIAKLKDKYDAFMEAVSKGEKKVNTKTLTPYDIIKRVAYDKSSDLDILWNNLEDYVKGESNTLVVADTSGSMEGGPLELALSLAIYFAEHNQGVWHNKFISFSSIPRFVKLKGNTLYEKYHSIPSYVENTNLNAVFELILKTAIKAKVNPEDLPKRVIIISDMQFDNCVLTSDDYFTTLKDKFSQAGYELPKLIFWNASFGSYDGAFQVKYDTNGATLISGSNPMIFESLIRSETPNPYEYLIEVLNNPYFDKIVVS